MSTLMLTYLPVWAEVAPIPLDDLTSLQVPPVKGAKTIINASFRNVPLTDALRMLAKSCGFNVILDDSVAGVANLTLSKVTLYNALASLRSMNQLAYSLHDDTLLVTSASVAESKAFNKTASYIIPLKYANAVAISRVLNGTLFANEDGSENNIAIPDFHTNSIMLQATLAQLSAAQSYVMKLDKPRAQKTWRLSHAQALDVANILGASVFNNGLTPPLVLGSGGGAAGTSVATASTSASGQNILPASLRVRSEKLEEGTQEQAASKEGISANIKLRARVLSDETVQINSNGPILVPDTRLNTLTLLGTQEQIDIVEDMIPMLDRKLPQVSIETSLIELSEEGIKEFGITQGLGKAQFGIGYSSSVGSKAAYVGANRSALAKGVSGLTYATTSIFPNKFGLEFQINALIQKKKAKLLANPTVIAMHDNESVVSIVDEIVRSVAVTQSSFLGSGSSTNPTTAAETTIGQAGIVLSLLPKVGPNGMITLRIWPAISSVRATTKDTTGNTVTLLSKRLAASQQVVMKDGQSLVMSGLIQETNSNAVTKIPGLSELPIVGALARSSSRNKKRSELLIVITPHILPDDSLDTPSHAISSMND
ncbi:MAG: hypothetical protein VKK59_05840 [Vampirovibrionales bacterium]|nr:hypothetical protein [Vampirovibrionales bacterium]